MLSNLIATLLLAIPVALANPVLNTRSSSRTSSSGDLTYYHPGLGACGETHGDGDLVAAVSTHRYDAENLCGKSIKITGSAGSVNVVIVDRCVGCAQDDIDLSPTAFEAVAGSLDGGRVPGTWEFI